MLLCSWKRYGQCCSVAIGDNGNKLIFEIWWNFFYNLFYIKNVADVNSIESCVTKRNIKEFSVVITNNSIDISKLETLRHVFIYHQYSCSYFSDIGINMFLSDIRFVWCLIFTVVVICPLHVHVKCYFFLKK